jgi:hypothetical protein
MLLESKTKDDDYERNEMQKHKNVSITDIFIVQRIPKMYWIYLKIYIYVIFKNTPLPNSIRQHLFES